MMPLAQIWMVDLCAALTSAALMWAAYPQSPAKTGVAAPSPANSPGMALSKGAAFRTS